jgi:hypothetical protein
MASPGVNLKPETELTVGAITAGIVYAIGQITLPNYNDVRADKPGNVNTYKSTKTFAWTTTAVVGGLALLGRSPTVLIVGGAAILFETWKFHYANHAADGSKETAAGYQGQ